MQLSYEQDTLVGRVKVKSISFHSSLGKFLVEIADYPESDSRSATQRIEAKVLQLQQNPSFRIEDSHHFLSESTPGVMIKSFSGLHSEIHAVFVDGQREYHLSSESFEEVNLEQVLEQTEAIVRSFELVQPETDRN